MKLTNEQFITNLKKAALKELTITHREWHENGNIANEELVDLIAETQNALDEADTPDEIVGVLSNHYLTEEEYATFLKGDNSILDLVLNAVLKDNEADTICNQKCIISHEGIDFESGGAFIGKRHDTGKLVGIIYADDTNSQVTNWHGDIKIHAYFGRIFYPNFGDRRRWVHFTYQGIPMAGCWCGMDYNMAVRVKQVKPS